MNVTVYICEHSSSFKGMYKSLVYIFLTGQILQKLSSSTSHLRIYIQGVTMSMRYTLRFKNSTQNAYHFAVYQKYPNSPGLDSVAWQIQGLGPGATSRVDWSLDYQSAIVRWDANDSRYSGIQMQLAALGQSYKINTEDRDIPVISATPVGTTDPGQIKLKNNTNPPQTMNLGLAIANKLVAAVKGVHSGESVKFRVHPKYYIACFCGIKEGQLVSDHEGVELGPVTVEFKDEYIDYTVEVCCIAGRIVLKPPVPTPIDY